MAKPQKKENFLVASFAHIEKKLIIMRKLTMDTAADLAKSECPAEAETFTVTEQHVDRAFASLFRECHDGNLDKVLEHFGLPS